MNTHPVSRTVAWLLAALLAVVAGLGEGLHLLPGLGHGVIVGDHLLLLWIESPCCQGRASGPASFSDGHHGQSVPILDEDDCPVCQLLVASFAPTDAIAIAAVDVVAEHCLGGPVATVLIAPAIYNARAPPQG